MVNSKDRKTTLKNYSDVHAEIEDCSESTDYACMQYCMTINMTGGFSMDSRRAIFRSCTSTTGVS